MLQLPNKTEVPPRSENETSVQLLESEPIRGESHSRGRGFDPLQLHQRKVFEPPSEAPASAAGSELSSRASGCSMDLAR